jgi:hypothetical protein
MLGAFYRLDLATLLVIGFALCVVVLLSSLPWIIGGVMDRRRRARGGHPGAKVVRHDSFERGE